MLPDQSLDKQTRRALLGLFWRSARGFWSGKAWKVAWLMTIGLLAIVLIQLLIQYRINVWNRDIFDAIEKKNAGVVLTQAMIFVPLALGGVGFAMFAVYARMRAQRRWRAWLNDHLLERWMDKGRYYQLNLIAGDHSNPEHRIGEDARIATDAPIDFAVGILGAILTVLTFIGVLWGVGGDITFGLGDFSIWIPGYLVVAVVQLRAGGRGQEPGGSRISLCADPPARERRKHRSAWRPG
jgi:vitamin B12/bleomycin/antimicrobial peptide transport system ATP-binding/permease protein